MCTYLVLLQFSENLVHIVIVGASRLLRKAALLLLSRSPAPQPPQARGLCSRQREDKQLQQQLQHHGRRRGRPRGGCATCSRPLSSTAAAGVRYYCVGGFARLHCRAPGGGHVRHGAVSFAIGRQAQQRGTIICNLGASQAGGLLDSV